MGHPVEAFYHLGRSHDSTIINLHYQQVRVTGWGRLCGECESPDTLQGISIPVLSEEQCGLTAEDRFCVADQEVSMCFVSVSENFW